jgi:hypothetical protein
MSSSRHAVLSEELTRSCSWDRSPLLLLGNGKALAAQLSARVCDGWKMPARTESTYSATMPITGASALSPMMASNHHIPCQKNGAAPGNPSAYAVTSCLFTESFSSRNHGANKHYGHLESLMRLSLHSFMGPYPRLRIIFGDKAAFLTRQNFYKNLQTCKTSPGAQMAP